LVLRKKDKRVHRKWVETFSASADYFSNIGENLYEGTDVAGIPRYFEFQERESKKEETQNKVNNQPENEASR